MVLGGLLMMALCGGLLAATVLGPGWLNNYVEANLRARRVVTSNSSQGYNDFQSNMKSGVPYYLNLYVYNVTNPDDIKLGKKPILNQLGPYVYDWKWYKFDINWSSDKDLVSFFQKESFYFRRDLTNPNLDPYKDQCVFPSIPYAAVRSKLGLDDQWWKALGLDILSSYAAKKALPEDQVDPFIGSTVDAYVWGFDSQLLGWLNSTFASYLDGPLKTRVSIQQNDTSEEEVRQSHVYPDVMHTGNDDLKKLSQFHEWQGKHLLEFGGEPLWGSEEANTVQGTDAYAFTTHLNKANDNQTVFVREIFRHVNFICNETQSLKGIDTNVYFLDARDYTNSTPNNYYLFAPDGVSNLSKPNTYTQGSPVEVLLSQPHFFQADPVYSNSIEILPPNSQTNMTSHNTFIWVEPITGITMQAFKRLQVNLKVKGSLILNPNLPLTYIPIVYFEETGTVSDSLASEWKNSLGVAMTILQLIAPIGYTLAGLLFLLASICFIRAYTLPPPDYDAIN
uniref:Uncharacterized protein n=1 Tax=Arcella intermedia TaxID=1963864 RepID=A0A6B2L1Z3_9EUKA